MSELQRDLADLEYLQSDVCHRQKKIQPARERNAREQQAGFRPGRGCADQLFCIRQVFELRLRSGQNFVVIFIDFAAAFDSVHRDSL